MVMRSGSRISKSRNSIRVTHIFKEGESGNLLYCWFPAMHTRVDIVLVSSFGEAYMLDVCTGISDRIAEIERIGNCFDSGSELSGLNACGHEGFKISPELEKILSLCDYWRTETGGIFDVSVEGRINLSGFLKGYALDEIRPLLEAAGVDNALVNMGNSSVLALGCQPDSPEGWRVSNSDGESFLLRNQCLTTSGNDSESRRHIINPLTGQYVVGKRTVSVVTAGGAEGEVRATEKFIMQA